MAPRYRLRSREHDVAIDGESFTIGRGPECDLTLDDPLVSRHHATLHSTPEGPVLEDHASSNGTLVNGARVFRTSLEIGDRITIGMSRFVLMEARQRRRTRVLVAPSGTYARPPATMRPPSPDRAATRANLFGLLIAQCERAFGAGDVGAADAAVSNLILSVRAILVRGQPVDDDAMERIARYGLALADLTGQRVYVDRVLATFGQAGRVVEVGFVEGLHELAARHGFDLAEPIDAYIATLRAARGFFGGDEADRVDRLEALRHASGA